jgi:hypothetical protein
MKIVKPDKASKLTPHPEFSAMADERLNRFQDLLQAEIDDVNDPLERSHLQNRMRLLQAERKRRTGGKTNHCAVTLVLQPEALHGLAGDIVASILPHTEAHPVALLVYLLAGFGNIIAHNAHWRMERTNHYLNLFGVLVGDTNRGRKGTSRSTLDHSFEKIDRDWKNNRVMSGLSSGQGLIWNVRDPITEHRPIKEKGKTVGYEDVVVDKGEPDKRVFIVEEEFSTVLKLAPVEGNILSAVIRQAWDSGNLRSLTSGRKSHPVKATDAHVSIVGHITKTELLRYLDSTEQANGFGNRFLWFMVERSKRIPNPRGTPDEVLDPLIERLADSVSFATKAGEISRDKGAETVWTAAYDKLTEDGSGMVASMTARAAPQVMRIASIYALLDRSGLIRVEHLQAAIALWDYANESTKIIFGDSLGDPTADRILDAINQGDGLDRTNLRDLFSRHNTGDIDRALAWLLKMNRIEETSIATGGRPRTVYHSKRRQP